MIEYVKPTYEMIEIIAEDMRKSDTVEVMASHGHTPIQALKYSFDHSEYSTIVKDDDTPFLMFGVSVSNVTTGLGHPWLLSSNKMFEHKERFLKESPMVIEAMVSVCPRLLNYVHHANIISITWLESLGFIIEDTNPYGVKGDLFHKFHMGVL